MKTWMKWAIGALALLLVIAVGYFVAQQQPLIKTKTITLTVIAQEGDFQIVCMDALQVKAGEDVGFSIDVVPEKGFSKAVAFTIEGGPPGITVEWPVGNVWVPGRPEPDNIQCNLTIPLDNSLVGQYQITLTGASVDQ